MTRKQKGLFFLLVLLSGAVLAFGSQAGGVLGLLALPFTLAGDGLRWLSLSGGVGNGAAIGLYVLLGLSPLALKGRRRWEREDVLLPLAAVVLLYVLYGMINPGGVPLLLQGSVGEVIRSGAVYSVLVTWGVLRLLRSGHRVAQAQIYRALEIFLVICAGELLAVGLGLGFRDFRDTIGAVRDSNTWPGQNLTPTYVFTALDFATKAAEAVLDALVMLLGAGVLRELGRSPYSGACVQAAARTEQWCRRSLTAVVLMNTALNLGQVFFAGALYNLDVTLRLPVRSLAISFGALALVRLLGQGKALKEDNDLFI